MKPQPQITVIPWRYDSIHVGIQLSVCFAVTNRKLPLEVKNNIQKKARAAFKDVQSNKRESADRLHNQSCWSLPRNAITPQRARAVQSTTTQRIALTADTLAIPTLLPPKFNRSMQSEELTNKSRGSSSLGSWLGATSMCPSPENFLWIFK